MIPAPFDYHAPRTLDEAIALLRQNEGAKVLAGGQSLIPAMRFRLAQPEVLVDINGLSQLDYIRQQSSYLAIGAMTREVALEESSLIHQSYALLLDTAKVVADPLVRQRATVGGNLAHADPANDHPATMLAYGASVVARGPGGERVIGIDQFFTGLFESALAPNEILTEIRVPTPGPGSGGAYLKIER
jgi:carbon-monoxide dehydrogenase medium subunit